MSDNSNTTALSSEYEADILARARRVLRSPNPHLPATLLLESALNKLEGDKQEAAVPEEQQPVRRYTVKQSKAIRDRARKLLDVDNVNEPDIGLLGRALNLYEERTQQFVTLGVEHETLKRSIDDLRRWLVSIEAKGAHNQAQPSELEQKAWELYVHSECNDPGYAFLRAWNFINERVRHLETYKG
jgi:hypothetical protein